MAIKHTATRKHNSGNKFALRSINRDTSLISIQVPNSKLGRILVAIGMAWDAQEDQYTPRGGSQEVLRRRSRKSAQRDKRVGRGKIPMVLSPAPIPSLTKRSEGGAAPTARSLTESSPVIVAGPRKTSNLIAHAGGRGSRPVKGQADGIVFGSLDQAAIQPTVVNQSKRRGVAAANASGVSAVAELGVIEKPIDQPLATMVRATGLGITTGGRPPLTTLAKAKAVKVVGIAGLLDEHCVAKCAIKEESQIDQYTELCKINRQDLKDEISSIVAEHNVISVTDDVVLVCNKVSSLKKCDKNCMPGITCGRVLHKCDKLCSIFCTSKYEYLHAQAKKIHLPRLLLLNQELSRRDCYNRRESSVTK